MTAAAATIAHCMFAVLLLLYSYFVFRCLFFFYSSADNWLTILPRGRAREQERKSARDEEIQLLGDDCYASIYIHRKRQEKPDKSSAPKRWIDKRHSETTSWSEAAASTTSLSWAYSSFESIKLVVSQPMLRFVFEYIFEFVSIFVFVSVFVSSRALAALLIDHWRSEPRLMSKIPWILL